MIKMRLHTGQSHGSFFNSSPHYSYINWDHLDEEMDFQRLDVPESWQVGEELYVGLCFDSKIGRSVVKFNTIVTIVKSTQ